MDEIKSLLNFEDYKVTEMIFSLNSNLNEEKGEIKLNPKFSVTHNYFEEPSTIIKVVLTCEIFDEDFNEGSQPFYLKVCINGYFEVETESGEEINDELLKSVSHVNTVAILFPYLRSTVTALTSTANISPLILPPVNINKLLNRD